MQVSIKNLTNEQLNQAVQTADRCFLAPVDYCGSWSHAGPLIQRTDIGLTPPAYRRINWVARAKRNGKNWQGRGATPQIAAMRCFVAAMLEASSVEVPDALPQL